MSFGQRLKEARLSCNMSQKELGLLIGVTGNAISNYENGISSPNDSVLLKIFNALHVEPNYLFQDSFNISNNVPKEIREDRQQLLKYYEQLDADGQEKILQLAAYIARISSRAFSNLHKTDEELVIEELDRLAGLQADSLEAAEKR